METSAVPAEPVGEPFVTGDVLAELEQPVEGPVSRQKGHQLQRREPGSVPIYGLFNFGMPLYLKSYGLPPWLIGLLANQRSFVGALVQPVVGRMSDRLRTPLDGSVGSSLWAFRLCAWACWRWLITQKLWS